MDTPQSQANTTSSPIVGSGSFSGKGKEKQSASRDRCGFCAHNFVYNTLTWKCPMVSGAILAGFNIVFLLFRVYELSLLNVGCIISLIGMGAGFAASMVLDATQMADLRQEVVSKQTVEGHLVLVYDWVNASAATLRHVLLWRNRFLSLQCCLGLIALAYISLWLSFSTLIFLGVNLMFFYEQLYAAYVKYGVPVVNSSWKVIQEQIERVPRLAKALNHPQHSKLQ